MKTIKVYNNRISYLFPQEDSLINNLSVSGTTFCINTCWSSCSPNGPRE